MFSFRAIHSYRCFSSHFRLLVENDKISIRKQRTDYDLIRLCATLASPVQSEISATATNKNPVNVANADNFGSLKHSLEKSKAKLKRRDVKIVKVKKRLRSESKEANVFGNLSPTKPVWYPDFNTDAKVDNDQDDNSVMVRNISKTFRSPDEYLQRMKQFVADKKLKNALELFIDMKRNFVNPHHVHFTYMIGACGRFGFTEMAFKLLRQLTDRGLYPSCATLTGLFNACGETPFPEFGLRKARLLKEKIKLKNWQINQITYHAMIKAFGKCGDIQTAFQVVDEMANAQVKIDVSTYSFLLMSCVGNKEAGFTHAIEVWRKMEERNCFPNIFSFNLLLRAARECDVGPEEVSCLLLQHWSSFSKRPYGFKTKQAIPEKEILQLPNCETADFKVNSEEPCTHQAEEVSVIEEADFKSIENAPKSLQAKKFENSVMNNKQSGVPSILNARPLQRDEVLGVLEVKTASDRLMLLGGADGVLANMRQKKVKPNIKTFTLLLECLPPTTEAEEQLMRLLDAYKVKPDAGFFNILIKRRNFRFDNVAAKEVLLLMNKWSLSPDILTFGVLALGCRNHYQFEIFISDMEKLGCCPNIEIVGSLIHSACTIVDFVYLYDVLMLMDDLKLSPDETILKRIEKVLDNARKNIIDMEHGKSVHDIYKRDGFAKKYKEFCKLYEQWLKNTKFGKEEHVWNQFRTEIFEKTRCIDI